MQFRIKYKLLLSVFKSLNGLAPKYLGALVSRYSSLGPLRSSDPISSEPDVNLKEIMALQLDGV